MKSVKKSLWFQHYVLKSAGKETIESVTPFIHIEMQFIYIIFSTKEIFRTQVGLFTGYI